MRRAPLFHLAVLVFWMVMFLSFPIQCSFAEQTQVETAECQLENGIPILNIAGIGPVEHPTWIATYALAYMNVENYFSDAPAPSDEYAQNCINWLKENAVEISTDVVGWPYTFSSTYNDVSIQAPWYSAYGQACGIEALVGWYEKTGDEESLNLARKSTEILFVPISEGGLLFTSGEDIWFEEIPTKDQEPSHILNGHMRACIALHRLYEVTQDETVLVWYEKGVATLERWLPLYDNGYWLRYDLNPKKSGLLFRFNNPYEEALLPLCIDEIRLIDPLTGESVQIDAGASGDMDPSNGCYIAGLDWQMESQVDGRTVRQLLSVTPEDDTNASSAKPNSYFYLDLPSEWTSNLRTDWFELTIVYKDEQQGHMAVEMRSIAPDEEFVSLRDGELLLTGSGEWREWTIPLRCTDLGWPVGNLYAEKHVQYLDVLKQYTPSLSAWADVAHGYYNIANMKLSPEEQLEKAQLVEAVAEELPEQNTFVPFLSVDSAGVALMHFADQDAQSVLLGEMELPTNGTEGCYSPYIIANQAMGNTEVYAFMEGDPSQLASRYPFWGKYQWITKDNASQIATREAAYQWLRNNAVSIEDGFVWQMNESNAYNDLVQPAGWQSSFWQHYVIEAFGMIEDLEMVKKAAYAYDYKTKDGGLSTISKDGSLWFEEVPNDSHILNAHIASLIGLYQANELCKDQRIASLYQQGVQALRNNLYRFDTGYWTKYDMNPQKSILFELSWDGTDDSPMIDTISLYDPVENAATQLNIGDGADYDGVSYIAGLRWKAEQAVDGCMVRTFSAYSSEDAANGVAAYLHLSLPQTDTEDLFDTPDRLILIRYKDTSSGTLQVLRQSIAEGNVLEMVPLQNAIIHCTGDGEWKTAVIPLRAQDLGWYMGPDYQAYHIEQLAILAEQTGDWYFHQTVQRWEFYLEAQQKEENS